MGASTYPVYLKLQGKRCLVVGAGPVGVRKVSGLVVAGADVTVVSPSIPESLKARVSCIERPFQPDDVDGMKLVVTATDSEAVNLSVVEAAEQAGVWVNDATSLGRSGFILPATVRQGDLTLAVSTGGESPAYARLIRESLEEHFGAEHAEMLRLLSELRPRVMSRITDGADRKRFWDRLVTQETLNLIKDGHIDRVEQKVEEWLSS